MFFYFKKNYYYLIIIIFIFFLFNTFLHSYIIINNNYNQRMLKNGGFCSGQAYGFVRFVNDKYNKLNINFNVNNFSDNPSSQGYFYKINKSVDNNYVIFIGISYVELRKILLKKKFHILEQDTNCYFIKIND